jgi:hypothetical protein
MTANPKTARRPIAGRALRPFILSLAMIAGASAASCLGGPEAATAAPESPAAVTGASLEGDSSPDAMNALADTKAPGRVYGEFEDAGLFGEALEAKPEMKAWSQKQVWDGLSGATIQAKTFGKPVPDRIVLEGGKVLAYADGFGQFWVSLAPGPHLLTGRCKGYKDAAVTVEIAPGSTSYLNFYLKKR